MPEAITMTAYAPKRTNEWGNPLQPPGQSAARVPSVSCLYVVGMAPSGAAHPQPGVLS